MVSDEGILIAGEMRKRIGRYGPPDEEVSEILRARKRRSFEKWMTGVTATPEVSGFDSHYKFYVDQYGELIRLDDNRSKRNIPLGSPVIVQRHVFQMLRGTTTPTNLWIRTPQAVHDGQLSEWDGILGTNDIVVALDTVEKSITRIGTDTREGLSKLELAATPASGQMVELTYSSNVPETELKFIHAPDNGQIIYIEPIAFGGPDWWSLVIVFAVPHITTNTQIKGHLRLATEDDADNYFIQAMYDFDGSDWDVLSTSEFTPDTADTTFRTYTFYANDDKYVSDNNLLAIYLRAGNTSPARSIAFYLDYAWAWLDRKSGWF